MLWCSLVLGFLYLLPGAAAARIFAGRTRWNPALWVLLSVVCVPVTLAGFGAIGFTTRSRLGVCAAVTSICLLLYVLAEVARRAGWAVHLPEPREASRARVSRALAVVAVIALTALVANTRLGLVSGRMSSVIDDWYRIGHITAIAATGVPPRNPYLPEAPLSYYYYDFVLPGLAVRLATPQLSVAWALAIHVVVQTFALGLAIAAVLFRLFRPWPALLGTCWLFFGTAWSIWPFSLLRSGPGLVVESYSGGKFLLQLLATLYAWVPQHMIAGSSVVFAAALIAVVEGPLWLRAVLLGVLFAFDAGCSVFVSFGLAVGVGFWFLLSKSPSHQKWGRRHTLLAGAVALPLCLPLVPTYLHRPAAFALNIASEQTSEGDPSVSLPDFLRFQASNIGRIPVHLLIDGGAPFALFAIWLWRERKRVRPDPLVGFLASTGVAFLPLPYLIRSSLYNDFGMRGIIASQFSWALGAVLLLDALPRGRMRRVLWAFALAGTAASLRGLRSDYHYIADIASAKPIPPYVAYLNAHTDLDDPVFIANGLSYLRDPDRYGLERMRLIDPFYIRKLELVDKQYVQDPDALGLPTEPSATRTRKDVCAHAARVGRVHGEVMVVARKTTALDRSLGEPVYSDETHAVYVAVCPP